MGDRRQLVSAMHALLENAITYSYDNSKVVVTGTVQRTNPNLEHPAVRGLARGERATGRGGAEEAPVTGEVPGVSNLRKTPGPRRRVPGTTAETEKEGAVEPVFTPEILDQYTPPGRPPAP